MKTRLFCLLMAIFLLAGCGKETTEHTVALDELSFTLPSSFIDVSQEHADTQQAFMFAQGNIYINGFKESKEELHNYFEFISLDAYVQMFCENNFTDLPAQRNNDIWNIVYTADVEGEEYTFLCLFYETESHFWRVQACCPTANFAENHQELWNYIASAD